MILLRGAKYHYRFMKAGKLYSGVCEGCTTKRDAEAYEKRVKNVVDKASEQRDVKQLVETFRDELSGGRQILLDDAFELAMKKPRTRKTSEKTLAQKREIFRDFTEFMHATYPDVQDLQSVLPAHAEAYISEFRTHGRFIKTVTYRRNGREVETKSTTADIPSPKTANIYLEACAEVFRLLSRDAGLVANPFDIPKLKKEAETREAFTMEELRRIYDNLDDFTRPLFTLAITTALREGDICTLRWSDIDEKEHLIRRVMNKTGNLVEIPITQRLLDYLEDQRTDEESEYVFPELAKMYQENPTGVSYRVKQFLERIGIETTRVPKGRSRAVSVKDLHSCRHTFCYYAGMQGIPLAVVQSIVGHMTPEMTRHYSAHATRTDKRKNMEHMEGFTNRPLMTPEEGFYFDHPQAAAPYETPEQLSAKEEARRIREELHWLIEELPIEYVKELLKAIYGIKEKEN